MCKAVTAGGVHPRDPKCLWARVADPGSPLSGLPSARSCATLGLLTGVSRVPWGPSALSPKVSAAALLQLDGGPEGGGGQAASWGHTGGSRPCAASALDLDPVGLAFEACRTVHATGFLFLLHSSPDK